MVNGSVNCQKMRPCHPTNRTIYQITKVHELPRDLGQSHQPNTEQTAQFQSESCWNVSRTRGACQIHLRSLRRAFFSLVLGQWAASDTHTLQHVCHHSLEFAHLPVFFGLDLLYVGLVRRLQLAQQRVQGRDIRRRRETPLNFTPYKEIILTCHGTQTPRQR